MDGRTAVLFSPRLLKTTLAILDDESMQIIPVMDVQNGVVVHGVAGQRSHYRRVQSLLTPSCAPSVLLRAFVEQFGFTSCYLADLDAIQQQQLNRCTVAELTRSGVELMVDRGVRCAADVQELLDLGVNRVVVALETLTSGDVAANLLSEFGSEALVLSLDLKSGRALTNNGPWQNQSPQTIAEELIGIGFRNMIVLDLAAVGMNQGTPTLQLCERIRDHFPAVSVITGGGVRSTDDLWQLHRAGIDGALVASALHDGRLTSDDVHLFRQVGRET